MKSIEKAPSYLIIHLKRFTYPSLIKWSDFSIYTHQICLTQYMTNLSPTYYDLTCVVVHKGMHIDSGHYIAFAKWAEQWYEMDDHWVYEIFGGPLNKHILNKEGYIFLYKKT